jgi:di/tricarboxylate transporter
MTLQQTEFFILMGAVLALLLWGRLRYDLVAAGGLFLAVVLGLVPEEKAFAGFSHPAVLIVALVLIASRALENSGVLALVANVLTRENRPVQLHIAVIGGIGGALSAVINNVAALALLMPLDVQTARKAGRSPGLTLMPLAFATILGGLITLIGTPPNIIASAYREKALGAPYQMFDFAPVGLVVALAGLAYVALIGWRLIPKAQAEPVAAEREEEFLAELIVSEGSPAIGMIVAELDEEAEKADVVILGLIRERERLPGRSRFARIQKDDVLIVEGSSDAISSFIKSLALQQAPEEAEEDKDAKDDTPQDSSPGDETPAKKPSNPGGSSSPTIMEAVVRANARLAWQSASSFRLRSRFGVTLLGISHQGRTFREKLGSRILEPGDVLLLAGRHTALVDAADWLGALPINESNITPFTFWRIVTAFGFFAAAIIVTGLGLLSFATAIAIAVAGYAAAGLVSAREFYNQIEWPIIVMLACLLPLGTAFEELGGTTVIANLVLMLTKGLPAAVTLIVFMIAVMSLSDVLNNMATMVMAGPLAIAIAVELGVNPDAFLMAAAVAASTAFLTPIGHKNNTLIMGPGGYAFGDYWRMGLPLEIVVLAVGVPAILFFWPL